MRVLFLVILFLSVAAGALAKDVPLVWDASPSPDIAGYRIYSNSTDLLPFQNVTDVGDVLSHTFTNIPDEQGIYFAATAYNIAGLESPFSNVVLSQSFVPPESPARLGGSSILNGFTLPLQ